MSDKKTIDVLVAEIGSTTTVINAFDGMNGPVPVFLGQGQARTTVEEGDVGVGLELALADLKTGFGCSELEWRDMLATSSAAGGLRMTVHGLVYDMTVRAAREAALGSGGVIKMVTAGKLRRTELKKIQDIDPNIIFLAGGTDYGERETALFNFEALVAAVPNIPVIYAGNIENRDEIALTAGEAGVRVYFTENVYPSLDQLNIDPARTLIHDVFEEHIIHSPGMGRIREMVNGVILPTPGAVMECAMLAREMLGDLLVVDVGGATTDVHSVSEGSPSVTDILMEAEPFAKRTVEGDLGVFVNRALTQKACDVALDRHAGQFVDLYGPTGRVTLAKGKDLTTVGTVIGTGGALTRLPGGVEILARTLERRDRRKLFPPQDARILLDNDYIMASLGALSRHYPQAARRLLLKSLGISEEGVLVE